MNTSQTLIALRQLCGTLRSPADAEQTDRVLLARFAAGNEYAFVALVRRHGPMVLGVCRRVLGNPADVEDAFQSTFFALARRAGRGPWRDSAAGWLHEVARRTAVQLRARTVRRAAYERRAGEGGREEPPVAADLLEALDDEVSRLPGPCREAILRCYFHGQRREQAARELGWSLRTLDRRLDRGRQLLHRRLTARGTTLAVLLALTPAVVPAALADLAVRSALGEVPGKVAVLAGAVSGNFSRWTVGLLGLMLTGLVAGAALVLPPRTVPPVRAAGPPAKQARAIELASRAEEPLPERAIARLGTTRFRHGFLVWSIACSRDGKVLATGGGGRELCLWDARTGRLLHSCGGPRPSSFKIPVALSPDGRSAASAEASVLKLWSVKTGKELCRFTGHTASIMSVGFSPTGGVLASGGDDNSVRLWDLDTGRQLHLLDGHAAPVWTLAFREDGKVLASASLDGVIRLWEGRTGKLLHVCKGHHQAVRALAFAPRGKLLASVDDSGTVRLWQSDTGKLERTLATAKVGARGLAFAPDGKTLAVGRDDGAIHLYDVSSGKELRRWSAHVNDITSLAYSPDGKTLASGAIWENVRLWNPSTGLEKSPQPGHCAAVDYLAIRPDGQHLFSFSRDGELRDWDLATKKSQPLFGGPRPETLGYAAISRNGKLLARPQRLRFQTGIPLYDTATGKERRALLGHKGKVLAVAFSPGGRRLASASADGTVRIWRVETGEQMWQTDIALPVRNGGQFFRPLVFSPDGKSLAFGHDDGVRLFDAATGKEIRRHEFPRAAALTWSPDSSHVALAGYSRGAVVVLWDVRTGAVTHSWQSPQAGIYGMTYSPDGRLLATSGDTILLWEVATAGAVATFTGQHGAILPVAFFPDGRALASGGGDSSVILWDVTGRSRNGKLQPVSLSPARSARLWELLGDADAAVAYAARWELVGGGRLALPFLKARLAEAKGIDAQEATRLVAGMDANDFQTREKAIKETAKLGLGAEPALRKALASRPGLEPRRRIDAVVAGWLRSADWLRFQRAVAVVESIGGDGAREVLATLAKGTPGARPTKEAAAALARLDGKTE